MCDAARLASKALWPLAISLASLVALPTAFMILRRSMIASCAVADPAKRTLPRAVHGSIGPDGRLRLLATLAAMYVRPWEGPALIRLAYEARLAFDTLERIAADPDFKLTRTEIDGWIDPVAFTGRSSRQVDEFLSEHVEPALRRVDIRPIDSPRV